MDISVLIHYALSIGADFYKAMVANAPGEKLLIGRRPVRNWTRRTISSLILCRKLHLSFEKSTKLLKAELHLLTLCTNLVDWGS